LTGLPAGTVGTVADLHESAARRTGLTDFGAGEPDAYAEGLAVLLDSLGGEAELTPAGSKALRAFLRGALTARLVSQSAWAAHPHHATVTINRPIFITGLPRTGTTALHRLLTADPASQGLEMWLTQVPQPRPPRDAWAGDPVFQFLSDSFTRHHVEHPEFMGLHHMAADQVEECWQLLQQSFRSVSFETLACIPGYSAWLSEQDWTGAYWRHRRNLQLIGLNDSDRRWVLKNPSHLFALDALLAVYPDALVIQTHREPRTAIASACSLAAHASDGWSTLFTGPVIGRTQLDLWARGLALFTEARSRHASTAWFCDVDYDDLVADPMGTVEAIYGHSGLPLTGAAADAMRSLTAASGAGGAVGRPVHRYALEEYGLTGEEVDERFAALTGLPQAPATRASAWLDRRQAVIMLR
jgi:Sulfotransferase family